MNTYQVVSALSAEDRAALKADIAARGMLVPVEYDENGAILDGHHRVSIAIELGLTDWPRIVRKGLTDAEKRVHARQINLARRHLTAAEKRGLIVEALKDDPAQSSRQVARMVGVDHKTAEAARAEAAVAGELSPSSTRTDSKGRKQPAKRRGEFPHVDKPLKNKRKPEQVALDSQLQAEADALAEEARIDREERIAQAGTGELVAEIARLEACDRAARPAAGGHQARTRKRSLSGAYVEGARHIRRLEASSLRIRNGPRTCNAPRCGAKTRPGDAVQGAGDAQRPLPDARGDVDGAAHARGHRSHQGLADDPWSLLAGGDRTTAPGARRIAGASQAAGHSSRADGLTTMERLRLDPEPVADLRPNESITDWTPDCTCDACRALKADRPSQWVWLPRKLLARGWAGHTDPLERAFIRAHAAWAQGQVSSEHMAKMRAARMTRPFDQHAST